MTSVVNLRSGATYDVYIGRPSKWGNPYVIGKDGTRKQVVESYRLYVLNTALRYSLHELQGKVLGCYCKPLACHGDVLAELAEVKHDQVEGVGL